MVRGGHGGWVGNVTLTGRRRPHRGKVGPRITHIDREYQCDSCGHVGWSAHIDLCEKMGDHRHLGVRWNGAEYETYLPTYAQGLDK